MCFKPSNNSWTHITSHLKGCFHDVSVPPLSSVQGLAGGGEARLHNRTWTVCIDSDMCWHLTRYFSSFLCGSITSGHSHTQPQTAAETADPITWIPSAFASSVFSPLKESENQKCDVSNVYYHSSCSRLALLMFNPLKLESYQTFNFWTRPPLWPTPAAY